jgi:hypothetical protein
MDLSMSEWADYSAIGVGEGAVIATTAMDRGRRRPVREAVGVGLLELANHLF